MNTPSHPDDANEEYRPMTDGGDVERPRANGGERTGENLPVGARVVDRDETDPNVAVVVERPDTPAYDYTLDALDGSPSVADLNPGYGASGSVATVVFLGNLDEIAHRLDPPEYRGLDGESVAEWFIDHREETDATAYTYPTERLRKVSDA